MQDVEAVPAAVGLLRLNYSGMVQVNQVLAALRASTTHYIRPGGPCCKKGLHNSACWHLMMLEPPPQPVCLFGVTKHLL